MQVALGIDDASNRSTHVPDGRYLKMVKSTVWCTTIPGALTNYTLMMWRRPGGENLATPIASYFSATDPITEDAMNARRFKMAGPFRTLKANGEVTAYKKTIVWRGNMKIRDGDDVFVTVLQDSGGNLNFQARNTVVYR